MFVFYVFPFLFLGVREGEGSKPASGANAPKIKTLSQSGLIFRFGPSFYWVYVIKGWTKFFFGVKFICEI